MSDEQFEFEFEFGPRVFSVSEFLRSINALFGVKYPSVVVEGEVTEGKLYRASGHFYFSLRDDESKLPCLMFSNRLRLLDGRIPEDGQKVQVRGAPNIYARNGGFKLIVESLEFVGEGRLREAFERLKRKLDAEGLFDSAHKKPLPRYPAVIGVVTSPEGAAVRDIIRVIRLRYPIAKILISPARVQGEGAAEEIIEAMRRLDDRKDVDVIVITRGGGSLEDLAAFNDESLARAIFACKKPVVSAVGHEIDFTIADFVADVRAATPSHAGEILVPVAAEIEAHLLRLKDRMERQMQVLIDNRHFWLDSLSDKFSRFPEAIASQRHYMFQLYNSMYKSMDLRIKERKDAYSSLRESFLSTHPYVKAAKRKQRLAAIRSALEASMERKIQRRKRALQEAMGRLESMNPREVLKRGFAVVMSPRGTAVRVASELSPGDEVRIMFHKGDADATIVEVSPESSD